MNQELKQLYYTLSQIGQERFSLNNLERSKKLQNKIAELKTELRREKKKVKDIVL